MKLGDPVIKQKIMPALGRISTVLLRCVIPLFQERSGIPELLGCGFLVQDGKHHFLVSAAHVFRHVSEGALLISLGGRRVRQVVGPALLTPEPSIVGTKDELDVGVIRLSGPDLPPYADVEKESIELSRLIEGFRGDDQTRYQFVGFPASKSGRTASKTDIIAQPYSYTNVAAPLPTYDLVKADQSKKLVLTFDKKRGIGPNGNIQAFPDPYGMSGSPVWALDSDLPFIPIVGVATRWVGPHRAIVATDIALVLPMIRELGK